MAILRYKKVEHEDGKPTYIVLMGKWLVYETFDLDKFPEYGPIYNYDSLAEAQKVWRNNAGEE